MVMMERELKRKYISKEDRKEAKRVAKFIQHPDKANRSGYEPIGDLNVPPAYQPLLWVTPDGQRFLPDRYALRVREQALKEKEAARVQNQGSSRGTILVIGQSELAKNPADSSNRPKQSFAGPEVDARGEIQLPGGVKGVPGVIVKDPERLAEAFDGVLAVRHTILRNAYRGHPDEETVIAANLAADYEEIGILQEQIFTGSESRKGRRKRQAAIERGIHTLRTASSLYNEGKGVGGKIVFQRVGSQ